MLNKKIRILNFDGSVIKQEKLTSKYDSKIIDLTELGPRVRYWIDPGQRALIERRIDFSDKNSVTFMGSGDFHHISEILISRFDEPISLIDFDFHPDWDMSALRVNCGTWINEVLKRKNILKAALIGVSSNDISNLNIQTANLSSLKDSRVEIYPYEHSPTTVFFRKVPANASIRTEKNVFSSKICWIELKNKELSVFLKDLLNRMPTKKVYITIDKDCLKNEHALTNWEEGKFSLEELLSMLKAINENKDIAGLDIVGDYSKVAIKSMVKRASSYLDHPRNIKALALDESLITSVNEHTNLKILEALDI